MFFGSLRRSLMTMVGGFDVHRKQITFDYVDDDGLVRWGQIRPATPNTLRAWLERALPGRGRGVLVGGLHWVAVRHRRGGQRGGGRAFGDPSAKTHVESASDVFRELALMTMVN